MLHRILCAGITTCIVMQQSPIREELQSETNISSLFFVRLANAAKSLILFPHVVTTILMLAQAGAAQIQNPEDGKGLRLAVAAPANTAFKCV